MYQQTVKPNVQIPYVGGLCEGFVEGTVGEATMPYLTKDGRWTTSGVYPSAIDAWNANYGNGNHPGEKPPQGVSVALYFTLKNNSAGHTAIWIGDGRVASSTQAGKHETGFVHPSLQNLIDVYANSQGGCTYLGWKEYIGRKRIVTKGDDMVPDLKHLDAVFQRFMGRNSVKEEQDEWIGKRSYTQLIDTLQSQKAYADQVNASQVGAVAVRDGWQKQINDLTEQLKEKPTAPSPLKPGLYEVK